MGTQVRKTLVVVAIAVAVILGVATVFDSSQTEWNSETSVQIAARRLDDGRVEFGLRQRQADGWSDLSLPSQRYLLPGTPVDEWQLSDEIAVTGTSVNVHIRDGVYVGDYLDEFLIYIDGQVYETNCGELQLEIVTDNVIFTSRDKDCDDWMGLATACGSAEADCDVQQAMIYAWEAAQRREYGFDEIELTLDEAQAIVDAVWYDYIRSRREAPTVEASFHTTTSYYSSSHHTINLSKWGRDLDTVLHETAHAIINAGPRGGGHDECYAAQILDLWSRYAPVVDTAGARLAAAGFGVDIAGVAPVRAIGEAGVDAVWSLLCTEPVRSERYCDTLLGALRTPVQPPKVFGVFQAVMEDGLIGDRGWYWTVQEKGGTLKTGVVSETVISEQPDRIARLNVVCEDEQLEVLVWWQISRGFSTSVLVRFSSEELRRQIWSRGTGSWSVDGISSDFRVSFSPDHERYARDLAWAASSGEAFTIQIRSGADTYTAVFDLEGLFETPVQPNLARCGREAG